MDSETYAATSTVNSTMTDPAGSIVHVPHVRLVAPSSISVLDDVRVTFVSVKVLLPFT